MGDHYENEGILCDGTAITGGDDEGNSDALKVLLSLFIVAMETVAVRIAVMMMKAKKYKNNDSPESLFQGEKPSEKTVVSEGDLRPDGSEALAAK